MFFLFGILHAGTVVLTGTCDQTPITTNHSYNSFSLLNSGNETATELIVIPDFSVGTPVNISQSIAALTPRQNITENFYFKNLSAPGTYAGAYEVSYSQGASSFFTTFPCTINLFKSTTSLIRISNINISNSDLKLSIVNLGRSPIKANVSLILPQSFYSTPPNATVNIGASSAMNISFSISHPKLTNVEYPLSVSISYVSGGLHYATLGIYTLNLYAKQSIFSSQYLIFAIIALIIIILIGLIILSILKKRRRNSRQERQEDTHDQTIR